MTLTPVEAALQELQIIRTRLVELVDLMGGDFPAYPRRYVINATNPFETFKVMSDRAFHSVKIDNPSAVDVDVRRDGRQPLAGDSDERVPPHTGRILTFPYSELSIGIDPGVVPGGNTYLYVTFYARALAPASYAFAP